MTTQDEQHPRDDTTLENEVFADRTDESAGAPPPESQESQESQEWPAEDRPPRTPRVFTALLGLVCLAVAGVAFASEFADATIDWSGGGPFVVIGAGVVIAILGIVGIQTSRDD